MSNCLRSVFIKVLQNQVSVNKRFKSSIHRQIR